MTNDRDHETGKAAAEGKAVTQPGGVTRVPVSAEVAQRMGHKYTGFKDGTTYVSAEPVPQSRD